MLVTHEEVKADEQLTAMLWDSVSTIRPAFGPLLI